MTGDVYRYLLKTYGRNPAQWLGYFFVVSATVINRIVVVAFFAAVASMWPPAGLMTPNVISYTFW